LIEHLRVITVHGGLAVELDGHMLADALDVVIVEIVFLQCLPDELLWRLLHQAAEQFAVQAAPVDIAHIGLRTSDGELFAVDEGAANLDAAVGLLAGELHLALQLEIAEIALAAKECVERNRLGAAADEKSLLPSPELGQALPVLLELR